MYAPQSGGQVNGADADTLNETLSERSARIIAEFNNRREKQVRSHATSNRWAYTDSNGRTILTNTPERYRGREGFTEFQLGLEKISVPERYEKWSISRYKSRDIVGLVKMYARKYRIDENLLFAIIKVESNFNSSAVSSAGAQGLMQLMPATAEELGVTNILDPAQNIAGGSQYISKCLRLFKGDQELALAAYNAGPGAVKKYGGIPPYKETQNYVRLVTKQQKVYKQYGVNPGLINRAGARTASSRVARSKYKVHFKSGLVQPADLVEEAPNDQYKIQDGDRAWLFPKAYIVKVEKPV
jgi:hypothetical protein